MKNRSKIIMFIILLSVTNLVSGCQLAKETSGSNQINEGLCGVFVTIDLDMSKFYQDTFNDEEFTINRKGELVPKSNPINPLSNYTIEGTMKDGKVSFEDIPGYYMGPVQIDRNDSNNNCSGADNGFYDVKFAFNSTDNREERSSEATLSVSRRSQSIIYVNPVYLRDDGSIYTILGQGNGYSHSGNSGMVYSVALDNETNITDSGIVKTQKDTFKINIAYVDEAKQIMVKEMNQQDELIKTTNYLQNDPDNFILHPDTHYIIVEELLINEKEEEYINRSIYSLEEKNLETEYISHRCNFPETDGVIGTKSMRFLRK